MVVHVFSLDRGIGLMFEMVHFNLIRVFGGHNGVSHSYILWGTTLVFKQLEGMFIGLILHTNNIINNFIMCNQYICLCRGFSIQVFVGI
jgi:hypothetical protein